MQHAATVWKPYTAGIILDISDNTGYFLGSHKNEKSFESVWSLEKLNSYKWKEMNGFKCSFT